MAIGMNRRITAGSGIREASPLAGRLIGKVTGDIIPAGAGRGFPTNRGDGFLTITGAGRGMAAGGAGFQAFQSVGAGRRIKSPSSVGAVTTVVTVMVIMTVIVTGVMVGTVGVRLARATGITADITGAEVQRPSSTTRQSSTFVRWTITIRRMASA